MAECSPIPDRTKFRCPNIFIHSTITSKINVTPKCVYLPISKLHSISSAANLLAHNNINQICYCGQISLQSAAINCIYSDNLTSLRVTFILLVRYQALFLLICCAFSSYIPILVTSSPIRIPSINIPILPLSRLVLHDIIDEFTGTVIRS